MEHQSFQMINTRTYALKREEKKKGNNHRNNKEAIFLKQRKQLS